MTFHAKLAKLMDRMNKSAVARSAGLPPSTITNILFTGCSPSLRTATQLAHGLGVDVGWLVDDTKDWPPVRTEESVAA